MSGREEAGILATELVTALVAIVIALLGAGVSVYTLRAQARQAREQAQLDKAEQVEQLMSRYRDPLVHAAFDLQSRLFNIVRQDFLAKYAVRGTAAERDYAAESTLFVVGQYLGWADILRREVQFLDLQDVERNRQLTACLESISRAFFSDTMDPTFRVFRGEQRAIGEVMTVPVPDRPGSHECLGYASFVARQDDPAFTRWFAKLRGDLEVLEGDLAGHRERLVALHAALIDLIDFLDPNMLHFPGHVRRKIEPDGSTGSAGAQPAQPALHEGPELAQR
jgi:hypothetical protein